MTGPVAAAEFLPAGTPLGLVDVGERWSAVQIPADWGHLVLDVLGDQSGPVFQEPARSHLVWILPARGGADWPDVQAAGVIRYGAGDMVLIPGPDGYHDGTAWLRSPLEPPLVTDPVLLRAAIEFVLGPLEAAGALGPMVTCQYCQAPTRNAHLTQWFIGPSGPLHCTYACNQCWNSTIAGGDGRHLRAVHPGPQ